MANILICSFASRPLNIISLSSDGSLGPTEVQATVGSTENMPSRFCSLGFLSLWERRCNLK